LAEKIILELDIDADGAVQGLNQVEQGVEDIGKSTKKAETGIKKFGKTLGNISKGAGIIGLISIAVVTLQEAFKGNQKVMDVFATATTALGIVVNDLFTFITDNAGGVIEFFTEIFENPLESIKDFGRLIRDNIIERFESLLDTLGFLADAIKKVFEGDFVGAMESAGKAGKEYIDILTGVNNTVDRVVEGTKDLIDATIEYTTATLKQADAITQAEKSLVTLENQQTRVREQADRDAERQRQIRDDFTQGIDVRIAANIKLGEILEKQQEDELAAVDAQIAALSLRLALDKENQDLQNQIFILNTERFAVEAQQEGFRSEQQINALQLDKEKLELLGFQTQAELDSFIAVEQAREDAAAKEERLRKKGIAADKKAAAEKLKVEQLLQNGKVTAATAALDTVVLLAEEGSELAKGAAAAKALIDTYVSANAAYASLSGIPVVGPVLGGIAAAAAVIAGLANVKSILAVSPSGGGSSGGGSKPAIPAATSLSSVAAPDFSISGDDGQSQLADTVSDGNNTPVRAFVMNGDIDDAQAFDRQTQNGATF